MSNSDRTLANAPIWHEAYVRGPDELGIDVLRVQTESGPIYFEMYLRFAANGNDFWVVIANFGIGSKEIAGSRMPLIQRKYDSTEIHSIRQRLENYFLGPEEKKFVPFTVGGAQVLGVEFADGWIVEKRPA